MWILLGIDLLSDNILASFPFSRREYSRFLVSPSASVTDDRIRLA
jgi:hypothetical protein